MDRALSKMATIVKHVLFKMTTISLIRGRRGHDRMVVKFTTTYAISAITTDVVRLNLDQGEVYNIML